MNWTHCTRSPSQTAYFGFKILDRLGISIPLHFEMNDPVDAYKCKQTA